MSSTFLISSAVKWYQSLYSQLSERMQAKQISELTTGPHARICVCVCVCVCVKDLPT